MNAELKAKWIEALRSGKYQQGRGALMSRHGDAFCCLGVLCDIQGTPRDDLCNALTVQPEAVVAAGIDQDTAHRLAAMNDGREGAEPQSFAAIASYIEQHIPAETP